ncbi:MAG: hypothetical protein WCI11_13245 [Candidatus Methylumidiphilus sp.]
MSLDTRWRGLGIIDIGKGWGGLLSDPVSAVFTGRDCAEVWIGSAGETDLTGFGEA